MHDFEGLRLKTTIFVLVALLVWAGLVQSPARGATTTHTLTVGGLVRTYLLHLPPSYARGTPVALVFVLHGGGGTATQIEPFTNFSVLADRQGFVVVYPDAVERNWNDGREVQQIQAQRERVDDVAFFSAMIETLARAYSIDPRRIFATGISNGGFMSQLLAIRLADRLAAIAAVAAGMAPSVAEQPPKGSISVLIMNGTEDRLVPYGGGTVAFNRGKTISTDEIVRKWTVYDQCAEGPITAVLPDIDPSDGTRVKQTTYTRCTRGTEVILYTIEGGGHTWPGGAQYLPQRIVGKVSRDINATDVIWQFFARHPRQ